MTIELSPELIHELGIASVAPSVHAARGGVELVEAIAGEWTALCDVAAVKEPFYRPEMVAAYARSFVAPEHMVLVTAESHNQLDAVLPLVEERVIFSGLRTRRLRGATLLRVW